MNIASLLERSARAYGGHPALASGGEVTATYSEFFERSSRLARALREEWRVARGDRIAIFCQNHRHYLEATYAVWIAGAAVVPASIITFPIGGGRTIICGSGPRILR